MSKTDRDYSMEQNWKSGETGSAPETSKSVRSAQLINIERPHFRYTRVQMENGTRTLCHSCSQNEVEVGCFLDTSMWREGNSRPKHQNNKLNWPGSELPNI